jgi:hypothetical protein
MLNFAKATSLEILDMETFNLLFVSGQVEVDASWMSGEKAPSLAFHFSLGILVP